MLSNFFNVGFDLYDPPPSSLTSSTFLSLSQRRSVKTPDLSETIRNLQTTVQNMQTSITKLEQAADQLHLSSLNRSSSVSAIEEIKSEIQSLKGLFLSRSQFPSIPQITPRIPQWQLEAAEVNHFSDHLELICSFVFSESQKSFISTNEF